MCELEYQKTGELVWQKVARPLAEVKLLPKEYLLPVIGHIILSRVPGSVLWQKYLPALKLLHAVRRIPGLYKVRREQQAVILIQRNQPAVKCPVQVRAEDNAIRSRIIMANAPATKGFKKILYLLPVKYQLRYSP